MNSRRNFLKASGTFAIGSLFMPDIAEAAKRNATKDVGVQLYTVR